MKWLWSFASLFALASSVMSQEVIPPPIAAPGNPQTIPHNEDGLFSSACCCQPAPRGFLNGTHEFDRFIGFMSNPLQNIDPRALTEIYPIFGSVWTSEAGPVPASDFQLYGAGLTVAFSDRFAAGLNQGGYVDAHLSTKDRQLLATVDALGRQKVLDLFQKNPVAVLALLHHKGLNISDLDRLKRLFSFDPLGRFANVEAGGDRGGWLNLGGFFQYTLIKDPEAQFLLTAGLRVEAPCGSHDIFQGHGPAHLAPYLTAGKEIGLFHVLADIGYYFPAGPGSDTFQLFYAGLHLDRQTFGWLYPLVEFNLDYATKNIGIDMPARRGFFNLDNFEASGNILTMAVGANAVLIRDKLEIGAVYLTSIATQHDFNVNGLMVKMVFRF